ncbi:MAG: hypothetical protein FJ123_04195 [Deltaproteobacteria bacterium]|nr:hypothetical protein [Deltaproteobacteria bacterium]
MGKEDYEDWGEYEDYPEELVEMEEEVRIPEWMPEDCQEEIARIKDPEVRRDQIEREEKVHQDREELNRRYEAGEINDFDFWRKNEVLGHKEAGLSTRRGLRSEGLDYADFGELSEELGIMVKGDPDLIDINDRVNKFVKEDPEYAEEVADRMYEKGELSESSYEFISEKVDRYKKKP